MATKMETRPLAEDTRRAIEDFIIAEARLLDERCFSEWRDLFAEDGYYWVPLRTDQKSPEDGPSLFFDDRKIMETRFGRLSHPRIHAQSPPHRTCHVVGSIAVDAEDPKSGEYIVHSSMIMTDYRLRTQRVFSGQVEHRLRPEGEGFRIVYKRVNLINCDDAFELIAVPF
jgi:benzoate/toluate 1,2-dioxygenase beta subunit